MKEEKKAWQKYCANFNVNKEVSQNIAHSEYVLI